MVEGRQLHVNKAVLSISSKVFEKMFQADFKEKGSSSVDLPKKSYEDILEMLLCIYPSHMKGVTREKVDVLLQLADEYQMDGLTQSCERFLLSINAANAKVKDVKAINKRELAHFMLLADRYSLKELLKKSTDVASKVTYFGHRYRFIGRDNTLSDEDDFRQLSENTLLLYLTKRVKELEQIHNYE